MSDVTKVTTGKPKLGGAMSRAPIGSAIPTNASAALADAYANMGYISADGLSHDGSRTKQTIRAWGGDIVLTPQTEKNDKYKVTLIEAINVEVLKMVHGDSNVSGTLATGITVTENSDELEEAVYVFDMIMRGGVLKRDVIPRGEIVSVSEVKYTDSDAVGYEVEINALPDASGNTHYEYIQAPT